MYYNLADEEITLKREEIEEILAWIETGVKNTPDQESRSSGNALIESIEEMIA